MITFSKLFFALLLTAITGNFVLAQAAWETPLRTQMEKVQADMSPATIEAVLPVVERIALSNESAWLPNYQAAWLNQMSHYMAGEDGCSACLDKMDEYLEKAEASDNNGEVKTLRASYYQNMLAIKPMRAPFYGPKASNLLEDAVKSDPENPRAWALLGYNYYYTPAMFGGSIDEARIKLDKAVALFDAEQADEARDILQPSWGADYARQMHKKLNEQVD